MSLSELSASFSYAQTKDQANLSKIVITDPRLDSVLTIYDREVNSKVMAVIIERYDGDYVYTLFNVGVYDVITKNPTNLYRRWNNRILLIYSGIEKVFGADSIETKLFYEKMRPLLPDSYTAKKIGKDLYESVTMTYDPIIWRFKVDDGKILWLRKGLNYRSEKVLYFDF